MLTIYRFLNIYFDMMLVSDYDYLNKYIYKNENKVFVCTKTGCIQNERKKFTYHVKAQKNI